MLYAGAHHAQRCTFLGSATGLGRGATREFSLTPTLTIQMFTGALNKKTSVPDGYRGGVAMQMALSDGGMAARLNGSGAFGALNLNATGNLTSDLAGSGTITAANLAGGINMAIAITGGATLSNLDMKAKAGLACSITIGAQPTAVDIAQAVWQQDITVFTDATSGGNQLKKKLTLAQFLGLQ